MNRAQTVSPTSSALQQASQSSGKVSVFKLLPRVRPYRKEFFVALACMVLFGATDGGVPFLIKYILDGVFAAGDRSLLYALPVALIVFALLRAGFDFGQQFLMARIGHRIVRDVRADLHQKLISQSPEYFITRSTGDLLSRITGDVLLLRTLLTDSIAAVLRDSIRLVTLLAAAVYLDPLLAAIAFVALPLGAIPIYRFGRRMRRLSKQGQDAVGSLSARSQESMLGIRVVKIFGREDFEITRFAEENNRLTDTVVRVERVRAFTGPVNEVLATLAVCGVLLYGGFSVIGGVRSQGDFIAFLVSVFLMYDPFKKLSRIHGTIQQGLAGAERIDEVLTAVPKIADPAEPVPLTSEHSLALENVSYRYPGSDSYALREVTLTIPEGSKVALVGFSGSGKSTLVDLFPRFIDPEDGVVRIGGTDVRKLSLRDLRKNIALVGQHTFLFNDTVFNNIAYGRPGASTEDVVAAARAAFADGFITALPAGYDTIVGEGGFALSGGERQRIAIARAILKDAPILILDEATASLDNRAEREVQSAIESLERGRTTLVIAHRLSTVQGADEIVVMREGTIVERGTHAELLAVGGEYARLHALQFSATEPRTPVIVN